MDSRSTLLEGATQVHARAVPWGLAEGRVYSIRSRYKLPIAILYSWFTNTLQVLALVRGDGTSCLRYN